MYIIRRQQLGQVAVHATGLRPYGLCKCRHDFTVCLQPAATAITAGHSPQQRLQHACNGRTGASAVCRAHHTPLGCGHSAGHSWPPTHQPVSDQHSQYTSMHTTPTAAGARPQQPARPGSCQEAFVRLSHHRRGLTAQAIGVAPSAAQHAAACRSIAAEPAATNSTPTAASLLQPKASSNPAAVGASINPADDSSLSGPGSSDSSRSSSSNVSGVSRVRPHAHLGKLSYRMVVSYDGTAYSGWQLQSRARTIQAEIERALSTVLREDRGTLCVGAAGRTDAGVHAVGQVVQFMTNVTSIDPARLPYKLNSLLPHDIRIGWMSQTAPDFNVTVSAMHKTYHYNLDTGACHDPLCLRYSHHVRHTVDLDAMKAAANQLVGTHDFTQFSNDSVERLRRNPVKTLQRFDVVQVAPNHVRLEIQGTGFLYKQVRHMTGVLLAVGHGKMGLDNIQQLLELGNSQPPGAGGAWRGYNVAPAKGLQLFRIDYPAEVDDPTALLYPDLAHDEFGRLLTRIPGASSVDEE